MRVLNLSKKCAVEIEYAECIDNRLIFTTSEFTVYYTDEYANANIAHNKLCNLVINGYIIVDKLYLKENTIYGK